MKCILVKEVGSFSVTGRDIGSPSDDEVLLKVSIAGLCRTDLKIIRVGHRDLVLPRIPGEEVVGTVCAKGGKVKGVEPGQRVYVYPGKWCGVCDACVRGTENLCEKMRIMGFHRDGGFAEYVLAPSQSLIVVPDSLSDDEAVFAEPLSCCLNALELGCVEPGKTVAIWGAGPAGTLLARAAKAHGAAASVIEPDKRRRDIIGGHAVPPDKKYDICVVAVGAKNAYEEALAKLNPRGHLVVFSGLSRDTENLQVDFNLLHYKEQSIVGAYGCCYRHGVQALSLIGEGKIKVDDMVSHKYSMWDLEKALSVVEKRQGMKVLLHP
ncbi:alcohol dehydrogenase catalytic domain-containing protein [Candidatus Auribacterota bacterium]